MDVWLLIGLALMVTIPVQALLPQRQTPPQDGLDNWQTDVDPGGSGGDWR